MNDVRCAGCRFFHLDDKDDAGGGECRFHPPQPTNCEADPQILYWPLVNGSDWCGQFEPRTPSNLHSV